MPTYEYRCPKGHEFELFQRMSDEPRAECPECGAEAERMLSAGAGFLFKGEGFYITDYRSDSYKEAAKKEGKSGSANDSTKSGSDSSPDSGSKEGGGTKATGEAKGSGSKGSDSGGGGSSSTSKPTGSD